MTRRPASPGLSSAAGELRFLLSRGYPRERCLTLVGDRHALPSRERELLRRSVLAPENSLARRAKLLAPEEMKDLPLGLDAHNLLITLESALAGRDLVRGDDGVIRDIARAAAGYRISDLTRGALDLILGVLRELHPAEAVFYLDRPVSFSGRLAGLIREEMAGDKAAIPGTALAVPVPERELKPFKGLVASADGELIDLCPRPTDLAGWIIRTRLKEIRVIDLDDRA